MFHSCKVNIGESRLIAFEENFDSGPKENNGEKPETAPEIKPVQRSRTLVEELLDRPQVEQAQQENDLKNAEKRLNDYENNKELISSIESVLTGCKLQEFSVDEVTGNLNFLFNGVERKQTPDGAKIIVIVTDKKGNIITAARYRHSDGKRFGTLVDFEIINKRDISPAGKIEFALSLIREEARDIQKRCSKIQEDIEKIAGQKYFVSVKSRDTLLIEVEIRSKINPKDEMYVVVDYQNKIQSAEAFIDNKNVYVSQKGLGDQKTLSDSMTALIKIIESQK